ncbi:EVE domain-containing protein [uncultured Clostridium sp.]|uniref:EVE domain-containing protein n=1 Tax=uncultured Clostridium sp. TaxID=59620 RepID=UPI00258B65E6|nr:EVE domain-containing protein [uncultured Clostridium sp.]
MKGRLLIVDDETLKVVKNDLIWGAKIPDKLNEYKTWQKTIIDIIGDMLNICPGDYVVLWKKATRIEENVFIGIYRVISLPYIDTTPLSFELEEGETITKYPYRVALEIAYNFINSITEYEFINDINIKNDIWTVIGKKVKGNSRASIPMTKEIISIFIKKFINNNSEWSFNESNIERYMYPENSISLDLSNKYYINSTAETLEKSVLLENYLNSFSLEYIPLVDKNGERCKYELGLYAIFNEEITKGILNNEIPLILNNIIDNNEKIEWYANYLPYGLEGREIDYMISTSIDGENTSKVILIEFMKDNLDKDHIDRAILYSKWVNKVICKDSNLVETVLISNKVNTDFKEYCEKLKIDNNIRKISTFSYKINLEKLELKLEFSI